MRQKLIAISALAFACSLGTGTAYAHDAAKHADGIQSNVAAFASANGLKGAIYGIIIVLFVLFEPLGLYGRRSRNC